MSQETPGQIECKCGPFLTIMILPSVIQHVYTTFYYNYVLAINEGLTLNF